MTPFSPAQVSGNHPKTLRQILTLAEIATMIIVNDTLYENDCFVPVKEGKL